MLKQDREKAFHSVTERTTADLLRGLEERSDDTLERLLNETIFLERQRLKRERASRAVIEERRYWKKTAATFYKRGPREQGDILRDIVGRYAREILGGFNPRLHQTLSKIIPLGIATLFNRFSPIQYLRQNSDVTLKKVLKITGPLEDLRRLKDLGTLIIVPTHQSNFDSIALGYALHQEGLPPVIYGAGINLFTNPAISFLMNHLGAYKVDRKKDNPVYKRTLKNYTAVSLEMGYHNLFFPGGTRSRSGALEKKLKLGLLGTSISAYINNLKDGAAKPHLFVVPCAINYGLCLEAETLIEDYLMETGKSRYIIIDDESSKPFQLLRFFKKLTRLDSKIHLNFGGPMDIFGNRVDARGLSTDRHGRPIDIRNYVLDNGVPEAGEQRDQQYTIHLGQQILKSYRRLNVAMSTHLIGFAFFHTMLKKSPSGLYRLLREESVECPVQNVVAAATAIQQKLLELARLNAISVDEEIEHRNPAELLESALSQYNSFHGKKCLWKNSDLLGSRSLKLLYYYGNKLNGYGLEKELQ